MEDGNCKANLNMEDHARVADVNNPSGTPTLAHENQAIKRQELEDGKSRQIPNLKPPQPLTHKSRLGLSTCNSNTGSITASIIQKEERKVYVREPAIQTPFISTVEMMNIFWKLHVYQKYQEALHSHPNFRSSILRQQHQKRFVRFVKPFHLNAIYQETPRNKSLYLFESKGELGIFCNTKKQVTVPKEFHFAIDERIPPPNAVADMFDKAPATAAAQTPSPQVVVAAQPVEATAVASSSQVKKEMERKQSVEKHRQRPGQLGKKCLVLANHFPVKVETNNLDISQYYINAAASWLILLLMFWSHSMFGLLDLSISPAISLVNFELIFASKGFAFNHIALEMMCFIPSVFRFQTVVYCSLSSYIRAIDFDDFSVE
ncbi:Protein TPX2 [Linum perenne]